MRTPSCVRKPEARDDSAFDGNAIFSQLSGWQCFNMSRADLLFRCVCERCYSCIEFFGSCYHLGHSVSLRHGEHFFAIAAFACFQESQSGWSLCLLVTRQENLSLCIRGIVIGELTVYTSGGPVVGYPGVCNHEAPLYRMAGSNHKVPRVTAPMLQATTLRFVFA